MWNQKVRADAEQGIELTARCIGGSSKDIIEREHLEEHSAQKRAGVHEGSFVVRGSPSY